MNPEQYRFSSQAINSIILLFGFLLSAAALANPIPVGNVDMVATGESHACYLTQASTVNSAVHCWGANYSGQLGDGSTISHVQPRPVIGLPANIAFITVGYEHTCALTQSGNAWCWGGNNSGQLGINSTSDQYLPIQVNGLSDVSKIDAGQSHTCAIKTNFETFCWGYNFYGQLGDGTNSNRLIPTAVVSMPAFANNISADGHSTCATTAQQGLVCWGVNEDGQLGDGTTTDRNVPTNVSGTLNGNALSVSMGTAHACAVRNGGSVWCWGYGGYLGDGTSDDSSIPVQVVGITGAQKISVGYNHSCATTQSNEGFCWGSNYAGQLGNSTLKDALSATPVVGLTSAIQISSGENFSCGVQSTGGLFCWGDNNGGKLGDGSVRDYLLPQSVLNAPTNGASLALGNDHSCMLSSNGALRCWGSGKQGQIGDGSYSQRLSPRLAIPASNGVTSVSAGEEHNCVLAPQGGVSKAFCWGSNFSGELGDGSNVLRLSPTPINTAAVAIASIAGGDKHTCLADASGNIECSGYSYYGQTCQASTSAINQFQQCNSALTNALIVRSGNRHSCALTSLNQVWCWGYNSTGQLGVGNTIDSSNPLRVSALDGNVIADISLGQDHSCALTNAGTVLCWGRNNNGELGNDTWSDSSVPVAVVGLTAPVAQLEMGAEFSCARLVNGAMQCWGQNSSGQLGVGNTTKSKVAIQVSGMSAGVADIGAGARHACAIRTNGNVQCWGDNDDGQLGNGFAHNRAWPAAVTTPSPFVFQDGFE